MIFSTYIGNETIDKGIIKELFERNYERVYKKAFMLLFDSELAKDATQEAFIKAYQKIDTLKDINKFEAWVLKIVRNTCRNMIKSSRNQNKNIVLYDNEENLNYNIDEFNSSDIPEKIFENKELRDELHKYINQLDREEQHIIFLRMHFNFTYKQLAEHLGLKESIVKSKAHRAKVKVYHRLQEYYDGKGQ